MGLLASHTTSANCFLPECALVSGLTSTVFPCHPPAHRQASRSKVQVGGKPLHGVSSKTVLWGIMRVTQPLGLFWRAPLPGFVGRGMRTQCLSHDSTCLSPSTLPHPSSRKVLIGLSLGCPAPLSPVGRGWTIFPETVFSLHIGSISASLGHFSSAVTRRGGAMWGVAHVSSVTFPFFLTLCVSWTRWHFPMSKLLPHTPNVFCA